jgi:hypothetical protein
MEGRLFRRVARLAANRGLSLAAFLMAELEQMVGEHQTYDSARERALERLRNGMDMGWIPPLSRDELYDR